MDDGWVWVAEKGHGRLISECTSLSLFVSYELGPPLRPGLKPCLRIKHPLCSAIHQLISPVLASPAPTSVLMLATGPSTSFRGPGSHRLLNHLPDPWLPPGVLLRICSIDGTGAWTLTAVCCEPPADDLVSAPPSSPKLCCAQGLPPLAWPGYIPP